MSDEVPIEELQNDEREALVSIYDGDAAFKQINPTTYQYKVSATRKIQHRMLLEITNTLILVWD